MCIVEQLETIDKKLLHDNFFETFGVYFYKHLYILYTLMCIYLYMILQKWHHNIT